LHGFADRVCGCRRPDLESVGITTIVGRVETGLASPATAGFHRPYNDNSYKERISFKESFRWRLIGP
jgi:hypothetical protein